MSPFHHFILSFFPPFKNYHFITSSQHQLNVSSFHHFTTSSFHRIITSFFPNVIISFDSSSSTASSVNIILIIITFPQLPPTNHQSSTVNTQQSPYANIHLINHHMIHQSSAVPRQPSTISTQSSSIINHQSSIINHESSIINDQ